MQRDWENAARLHVDKVSISQKHSAIFLVNKMQVGYGYGICYFHDLTKGYPWKILIGPVMYLLSFPPIPMPILIKVPLDNLGNIFISLEVFKWNDESTKRIRSLEQWSCIFLISIHYWKHLTRSKGQKSCRVRKELTRAQFPTMCNRDRAIARLTWIPLNNDDSCA